jgi:hypothetical protein
MRVEGASGAHVSTLIMRNKAIFSQGPSPRDAGYVHAPGRAGGEMLPAAGGLVHDQATSWGMDRCS